jgi:hypothetical protein
VKRKVENALIVTAKEFRKEGIEKQKMAWFNGFYVAIAREATVINLIYSRLRVVIANYALYRRRKNWILQQKQRLLRGIKENS